jgi:putative aldouronate transport system substrate-binding protein
MTRKGCLAFCLTIAILLSLNLIGCSKINKRGEQTDQDLDDLELLEDTIFGKYSPEITLVWGGEEPSNPKYPTGENYQQNRWIDLVKEELGINIKYDWVAPSSLYDEKVNVVVASGDIPDAMKVNSTQFKKLFEANLINTDLQEILNEFASPTLAKDYSHLGSEGSFGAVTINGKLAAIPYSFSATGLGTETLLLRRDWMNELGLSSPTTIDDLYAIFDAFKNADFDGNGKDDTVGFIVDRYLNGIIPLFWSFHAHPGIWIKNESGTLVYGSAQPEVKNALAKFNDMYLRGYIDSAFTAMDWGTAAEMLLPSNRCGALFGSAQPSMVKSFAEENPYIDYECYPLPLSDDKPVLYAFPSFNDSFIVINKEFPHPEAVVKLLGHAMDLAYGPAATYDDYITYIHDWDKEITPSSWIPWFTASAEKNYTAYKNLKDEVPYDLLNPEEQWIYDAIVKYNEGDKKLWWIAKFFEPVPGNHYFILDDILDKNQFILDEFYGAPLPSMLEHKAIIDRLFHEMCIKIISGQEPIDSFDSFISQMNEAGLQQMTEEINEWYLTKSR